MNLLNLAERFGERLQSPVSKVHLSQSRLHAGAIHHKPRGGVWQGTIDMVLPLKRQFPLRTYGRQITQLRPKVNGAQMGRIHGPERDIKESISSDTCFLFPLCRPVPGCLWKCLPLLEFQFSLQIHQTLSQTPGSFILHDRWQKLMEEAGPPHHTSIFLTAPSRLARFSNSDTIFDKFGHKNCWQMPG